MKKTAVSIILICGAAFMAQPVLLPPSAAASGTRLFTCAPGGGSKDFSDEHCTKSVAAGTGSYGHVSVPIGETTTITGSNAATKNETKEAEPVSLLTIIGGVQIEIVCTTASASGTLKNEEPSPGVYRVRGNSESFLFSGCTVTKPAGKNCQIKEGKVATGKIAGETKAGEMATIYRPESGENFAVVTIEKCTVAALNGSYQVRGSITAHPEGATSVTTDAETTGTLTFGGQKAGFAGKSTTRRKEGNPVVVTTVP